VGTGLCHLTFRLLTVGGFPGMLELISFEIESALAQPASRREAVSK
jgi:hypothetical protein